MSTETTRPLQVYLDSSDFSILSDPTRRTEQVAQIERRLLEYRDSGLIELRFSYAHVIEAAPIGEQHHRHARARFECIERLCQRKALIAPSSLIESELRRMEQGADSLVGSSVYRDDGNWIPELSAGEMGFGSPETVMRELLTKMPLGQTERRTRERLFFSDCGQLQPAARQFLREALPVLVSGIKQQFPLTPSAAVAVGRYYVGEGTREDMLAGLVQSFSDLRCFADWFEVQWDKVSPVTNWLRASGDQFRELLLDIISESEAIYARTEAAGLQRDEVSLISRRSFEDMHSRLFASIANKLASTAGVSAHRAIDPESWRLAPGLFSAVELMVAVAKSTALALKGARAPKRSDLGDIVHALYVPYVDIFRADAFMANAIQSVNLPTINRVCSSLVDLPKVIEDAHRLRDSPRA